MKILLCTPRFFGYDRGMERALAAESHEVLRLTYDESWRSFTKRVHCRISLAHFLRSEERLLNKSLVRKALAFKPDLLLIVKGEFVKRETLENIRESLPLIRIVMWQNDNLDQVDLRNIGKSVDLYDIFFTYDKGDIGRAGTLGFRQAAYLPTGFDHQQFYRVAPSPAQYDRYGCDVSFIGRPYPKRQEYLRTIDRSLALHAYGASYPTDIPVKARFIELDTVNTVYNCSTIGLSMHENPLWQGVNNRTYEICGSGCFCLVDTWNDIGELFEVDREIVTYDSPEEMNEKINRYLADDRERRAIAEQGARRVHAHHTFGHRMRTLLSHF